MRAVVGLAHRVHDVLDLLEKRQMSLRGECGQRLAQLAEMCADVDHSVVGLVEVLLLADGPACQLSQAL